MYWGFIMHANRIELEGVLNARDLSSIKNKDGFYIKKNKLIRSDRLCDATYQDMKKLYDEYNLRTIVDFRDIDEFIEDPDARYDGIEYVHDQVIGEGINAVKYDKESIRKTQEIMNKFPGDASEKYLCEFYIYAAMDEYPINSYHRFIKELVNNEDCILWHCSLGKDRCGLAALMIEYILDVDMETIKEDYMYTNTCLEPLFEITDIHHRARLEYLDAFFNSVNFKFGSFDKYLENLGVTPEVKQLLKDKYLEK